MKKLEIFRPGKKQKEGSFSGRAGVEGERKRGPPEGENLSIKIVNEKIHRGSTCKTKKEVEGDLPNSFWKKTSINQERGEPSYEEGPKGRKFTGLRREK